MVFINKPPPKEGHKLMVVATTSLESHMTDLGLTQVFNHTLHVPLLTTPQEIELVLRQMLNRPTGQANEQSKPMVTEEELQKIAQGCTKNMPIKEFLMILERAKKDVEMVTWDRFRHCLYSVGYQ